MLHRPRNRVVGDEHSSPNEGGVETHSNAMRRESPPTQIHRNAESENKNEENGNRPAEAEKDMVWLQNDARQRDMKGRDTVYGHAERTCHVPGGKEQEQYRKCDATSGHR